MQEPLTTLALRALAEPSDVEDVLSQLSGGSVTSGTRSVASGSESASQLSGTGSQISSSGKASSAARVAAQEAVRARPVNNAAGPPNNPVMPEPRELEMPAGPGENQGGNGNRKAIAYLLAPAVAFMVTFNVAPALAPAFFTVPVSGKSDRRKIVLASAAAAVAAFLAVRCVM